MNILYNWKRDIKREREKLEIKIERDSKKERDRGKKERERNIEEKLRFERADIYNTYDMSKATLMMVCKPYTLLII